MAYEVLARKWRPQQFDEVVGQAHVTETLKNAIKSDRVAHAYLFVGPRGTGKTSTARIMAKALNCAKGPTGQPCDKCDSCLEIMGGNNLDVLEIDAASNTGVDHVRELRDNVRYAPARGPFKIYIIDEVHMLSIAAFNALLKTLEEPPAHVKFLFATTEPQKVPATILSRCQRFDLRRISAPDIVKRLTEITRAEGVTVDEDALLAIARGAEGGLRDAESAMDQLIAFRGRNIQESDVLSVFGLVARHTLEELAESVLRGDVPAAIRIVAELDSSGKDIQRVVLELLEYFRNVLIVAYAGESQAGLELVPTQAQRIARQAEKIDPARVLRVVDILSETENRMRYALSRRTLLEAALIKCARAAVVVSVDQVMAQLTALRDSVGSSGSGPQSMEVPMEPASPKAEPPVVQRTVRENPPVHPSAAQPVRSAENPKNELSMLSTEWHDFVERVGRVASLAKGYLIDAKPLVVTTAHVTIGFDPEFSADKEKMDIPRNTKAVEKVLSEMLGRAVTVDFRVLDAKSTVPGDIKVKSVNAAPAGKTEAGLSPEAKEKTKQSKQEWINNPAVRKTLEMFNGDIVDIRE